MTNSAATLSPTPDAAPQSGSLGILVVDDEPDMRELLSIALRSAGNCSIVTAGGAREALRAMDDRPTPFDAVLLDIQMPETTGIELCGILRKTPGYDDVPVIMLTAMTERRFLQDAFAAGANDYISKPFDLDDVKARLSRERLIGKRRQHLKSAAPDMWSANVAGRPSKAPREVIRSLEDPVSIPGTARFVTREAFETYILKTAQRRDAPLVLKAIKIAGVYDIFSHLDKEVFQQVVEEIARVISDATADSRDMLAHLGNGIFVSARSEKAAVQGAAISAALEKNVFLNRLAEQDLKASVVLGEDIDVTGHLSSDVLFKLARAVESVESAEEKLTSWRTFREWLSFRKSIGQERSRIDRSAYQRILEDFVDEGELGWK